MAYCLDDILPIFRKGLAILSTFWTGFYFFNSLLLFTGFSLMAISFKERKDEGLDDNRAALSGNHIVNVGTALFCMGVTLQLLRPLRWFLVPVLWSNWTRNVEHCKMLQRLLQNHSGVPSHSECICNWIFFTLQDL